jgi:hypothetical protein
VIGRQRHHRGGGSVMGARQETTPFVFVFRSNPLSPLVRENTFLFAESVK